MTKCLKPSKQTVTDGVCKDAILHSFSSCADVTFCQAYPRPEERNTWSRSNCACVRHKRLFIFLTVHVKLAHTCMYHTQADVNVLVLLVSETSACSCSICEGIRLKCLFMFYLSGCHSDAYSCFVCSCVRLRGIFVFCLFRCQTSAYPCSVS